MRAVIVTDDNFHPPIEALLLDAAAVDEQPRHAITARLDASRIDPGFGGEPLLDGFRAREAQVRVVFRCAK